MEILFKIAMTLFGVSVLLFMWNTMKHFEVLDRTTIEHIFHKNFCEKRHFEYGHMCNEIAKTVLELQGRVKKLEEQIKEKQND